MSIRAVVLLLMAVLWLPACQTSSTSPWPPRQEVPLKTPDAFFGPIDLSSDALRASLIGKTKVFHDPGHGTQVAYYSSDMKEYLWYPGNKRVVVGIWELRKGADVTIKANTTEGKVSRKLRNSNVCFQYGANTYNPVTGRRGSNWECTPSVFFLRGLVESRDGDVFKLSSGNVPYRLDRNKTTISELLAKCRVC